MGEAERRRGELLARVPLFSKLDERELRGLLAAARVMRLGPRQELFHKGDPGSQVYVILSGRLKALTTSELYHNRFKTYPRTRSGLQFLLAPLKVKLVDLSEKTIRNMYICPGDDDAAAAVGPDVVEAYRDLENIDPTVVSYAGRNTRDYPLRRKHAGSEVIACDAGGPDGRVFIHRDKCNVLYLDQSVQDIDIVKLPNADETAFEVGPNSPLEALRKLNKEP